MRQAALAPYPEVGVSASRNSVSLHDLVRTSLEWFNGHCYAVAPSARVLADTADLHLARELAPRRVSSTESVVAVVERVSRTLIPPWPE